MDSPKSIFEQSYLVLQSIFKHSNFIFILYNKVPEGHNVLSLQLFGFRV